MQIDDPGLYPFVSHAFAAVDEGQVGLLKVGRREGHDESLSLRARVAEWAVLGSNQRPPACKAGALPAELTAQVPPAGFEPALQP